MSSLINSIDFPFVLGALIKVVIFWITIMIICAYAVYAERRVLAVIQNRLGPNRVGWQGLLQPFADLIKFIFKEDIIPMAVNRALYVMAPVISLVPAMMVLIVYPFGPDNLPIARRRVSDANRQRSGDETRLGLERGFADGQFARHAFQRRHFVHLCNDWFGRVWNCRSRLGVEFQVQLARRIAFFGADGQL
jgi:hypothetical protein